MGHPDARVEQTLTELGASRAARIGAERLFSSWEEMAEFFVTVFGDTPVSLVVSMDVSRGALRSSYDVDGVSISTMGTLGLAVASGATLSEDRRRIAAVFRALTFQAPPALAAMTPERLSPLWEELRYFDIEGLGAFDSYDIMSGADRRNVSFMLSEHRLPLRYVKDIAGMSGLYPDGVKAFYSLGVPAEYAVEVTRSIGHLRTWEFYEGVAPTEKTIGSMYGRLKMVLGGSASTMAVTWHVAALYLETVPAAYAVAGAGRAAADIVRLHEAEVSADYLRAVGLDVRVADILRGYREGVSAEYLAAYYENETL